MYIVIEKHGGWEYAAIVTNEDGENKLFDTLKEAQEEADDCQDGIVIPENDDEKETLKYVIKEMYEAYKDSSPSLVHIGDLICKVLNINATFTPSGVKEN